MGGDLSVLPDQPPYPCIVPENADTIGLIFRTEAVPTENGTDSACSGHVGNSVKTLALVDEHKRNAYYPATISRTLVSVLPAWICGVDGWCSWCSGSGDLGLSGVCGRIRLRVRGRGRGRATRREYQCEVYRYNQCYLLMSILSSFLPLQVILKNLYRDVIALRLKSVLIMRWRWLNISLVS